MYKYTELIKCTNAQSKVIDKLVQSQLQTNEILSKVVDELSVPSVFIDGITSDIPKITSSGDNIGLYEAIVYLQNKVMSGRKDFKDIVEAAVSKEVSELKSRYVHIEDLANSVSESGEKLFMASQRFSERLKCYDELFSRSTIAAKKRIEDSVKVAIDRLENKVGPLLTYFENVTEDSRSALKAMRDSNTIKESLMSIVHSAVDKADDILEKVESIAGEVERKNKGLLDNISSAVDTIKAGLKPMDDKINAVLKNKFGYSATTETVGDVSVKPTTPGRSSRRK